LGTSKDGRFGVVGPHNRTAVILLANRRGVIEILTKWIMREVEVLWTLSFGYNITWW
jgi:hypothetical protein